MADNETEAAPPPYGGGYGGGYGGMQPGAGAQPVPTTPADDPTYKDRLVTDEDVRSDWEFTILMAVMLDPPPPAAPATPAPGQQASVNP